MGEVTMLIFRHVRETVNRVGPIPFAVVGCRRDPRTGAKVDGYVVVEAKVDATWDAEKEQRFAAAVRKVAAEADAEWVAAAFPQGMLEAFAPPGTCVVVKLEHEREPERAWSARLMQHDGSYVLGVFSPLRRFRTHNLERLHPRSRRSIDVN